MMNEGVPVKTVCFSKQQQQPVLLVSVCSLFFCPKMGNRKMYDFI